MASRRGVHRVIPLCRVLLAGKEGKRALSSGSAGKDSSPPDSDLKALFADLQQEHSASSSVPSTHSVTASSSIGESRTEEPKLSPSWSFLEGLHRSTPPRFSYPRPQTSSSTNYTFRKLGQDSGIDFLKEELDGPATKSSEPAEQQEAGEKKSLHYSTFKLLRDSFQKAPMQTSRETVGNKSDFDDAIGLDSSLFSTPDTGTKRVESLTLAEVEDPTMYQSPVEDIKTYTYEELGEKLRQVRPPVEQMLSSATGLSFGELRTRLQKIEEAENEASANKDVQNQYVELKESLSHMKSAKPLPAKRQLSYEELAFVNHVGLRTGSRDKLDYTPPKDELLTQYYSDVQLSSKERLKLEIKKLREEFQTHDCDSGSPQVQIAILTARINNLNRHMREGPNFKRDKHSKKGLSDMVQYRRRLLRYLRRRDWPIYCNVLTKLKLDDVILEKRR